MKQPTQSGWIGVLIGIVVFGSIVGHVASNKKCKAASSSGSVKDTVQTITAELKTGEYTATCSSSSCLQYYPPLIANTADRKGKAKVFAECGTTCLAGDALKAKMGAATYQCSSCDTTDATTTAATCKTLDSIKADLFECYSVAAITKNTAADLSTETKHFCMDECQYFFITNKLTVGCKEDIKTASATPVKCPPDDVMCEQMIDKNIKCLAANNAGRKIDSVEDITKAVARGNWAVKCAANEACLIYYPPSSGNHKKGQAMVLVECDLRCGDASSKVAPGYQCSACDPVDPSTCQKFDTVKSTLTECITYNGNKNGLEKVEKKIYCMDKCQYSEVDNIVKVGCAESLKGTDCPVADPLCEKLVLKSHKKPDQQGGGGGGDQQGGPTTPARKHGNRVTVPTCLIGTMAILLFAASQYVTLVN